MLTVLQDLIPEVQSTLPTPLKYVHYWTDSPTSQYRNKSIFSVVAAHKQLFGVSAAWNYFEAGHGKGPCDGVGGTAKRLADQAVKSKKARIQDADDFFRWASQTNSTSTMKFMFVSREACAEIRNAVQEKQSQLQAVRGTMSLHAVVGVSVGKVRTRETSCYCADCFGEDGFRPDTHCLWKLHSITDECTSGQKVTLKKDDWVAAVYEGKWYLGQVLEDDEDDCLVNFMEGGKGRAATQAKFKWPRQKDELWVAHQDILCVVEKPIPAGKSERLFTVSSPMLAQIEERFSSWLK